LQDAREEQPAAGHAGVEQSCRREDVQKVRHSAVIIAEPAAVQLSLGGWFTAPVDFDRIKRGREPPAGVFREAGRADDDRAMTAVFIRGRFPGTCGTGLAQRLTDTATCRNRTLRFLRYPS
jgi:hypothetical protein